MCWVEAAKDDVYDSLDNVHSLVSISGVQQVTPLGQIFKWIPENIRISKTNFDILHVMRLVWTGMEMDLAFDTGSAIETRYYTLQVPWFMIFWNNNMSVRHLRVTCYNFWGR